MMQLVVSTFRSCLKSRGVWDDSTSSIVAKLYIAHGGSWREFWSPLGYLTEPNEPFSPYLNQLNYHLSIDRNTYPVPSGNPASKRQSKFRRLIVINKTNTTLYRQVLPIIASSNKRKQFHWAPFSGVLAQLPTPEGNRARLILLVIERTLRAMLYRPIYAYPLCHLSPIGVKASYR